MSNIPNGTRAFWIGLLIAAIIVLAIVILLQM